MFNQSFDAGADVSDVPFTTRVNEGLEAKRERTVRTNATDARRQFFALLDEVSANPDEVVEVAHRDHAEPVLLVHADYRRYVRQLESLVHSLIGRGATGARFQLGGSITIRPDVDAALETIRNEQGARSAAKFADL
jgi:hypothetical protein